MTWRVIAGDCVESMAALAADSVDAVVTDPPYGIGFMGHEWDQPGDYGPVTKNGTSGPSNRGPRRASQPAATGFGARFGGPTGQDNTTHADRGGAMHAGRYDLSLTANRRFQAWCERWAIEAFRVLKPGGHLMVFGGTRTYHRMAAGVEDAGFEIRDCMMWLFGSGFPKSLDVAKGIDALDAAAERDARAKRSQEWMRQHVTAAMVDEATGSKMGHHITTHPTQPFVPTPAMLDALRPLLPEVPAWLEELVSSRAVESQNLASREIIGERTGTTAPGFAVLRDGEPATWPETAPLTEDAQAWQGWGTALKPGHEPIVVARKPFRTTVAANVLEHGTGALNIDGCRIAWQDDADEREAKEKNRHADFGSGARENAVYGVDTRERGAHGNYDAEGRWPVNVALDPEAAALLDAHSAGAARFFYCAKASSAERSAGLDGERNDHPTVKPIELMRWLVRLVTPPGGTILDPFVGSGTTGCAAVLEGFDFVGCERDPDYVKVAQARIGWWTEHPEGVEIVRSIEADRARRKLAESGQIGLFG